MDLEYGLPRVQSYDEGTNQRAREDSLDQLDEARTVALMHSARYQQALRRYQAQKIQRRDFNEGDLVLRLRQDNRGRHKLSPPWEGPYVVVKVLKPGCRMDLPGPTSSVGTRTDYSVGPWDYSA
jgi:hypothetical protein